MAITKDLSKGIVMRDDAETQPPIAWPTSKALGYMMATGGTQQFGNMSNGTNVSLVSEGQQGAPKPRTGTKCYCFNIVQQHGALQYSRSELYWGNGSSENIGEEWYAVSIYFPTNWGFDSRPIGIGYDFKWPNAQGPANLNLKLFNDELRISHEAYQGGGEKYYSIGKVVLGQWIDFAIRFKRSSSDGIIEVYMNKVKKLILTGPTSTAPVSYCLFGPYKWQYSSPDGQGEGQGTYNGPIRIFYDEIRIGNSSATIDSISPDGTVTLPPVEPPVEPPITGIVYINAGGSESLPWIADKYYTGGSIYSSTAPIADTILDGLYQSERWGNMEYKIPVKAGKHTIKLHFAEIYHTAAGKRKFDVNIEGKKVLAGYDIFAKAGANKAVIETFDVDVSADGIMNIQFVSLVNNAKVSAIQIEAHTVQPPEPPVDTTNYYISTTEGTQEIIMNGVKKIVKTQITTWKDGSKTTTYKKE